MKLNFLAFSIPFFLLLIYVEYLISIKKKLSYPKLHSTIANISVGIADRLSDVLITGTFYFIYDSLQKKYGIFHIKPSLLLWIALLLATDFIWYWYHRLAHEINVLWAVHIVHHQSDDYNFTVSARITLLQAFVRTGFWCVLPILGFPASMITTILLVHGLYPFFVHTKLVGKLGILEYLLVTPSHHRVHHASNEQYLDKNYGDVLIIWDKLFGTFQKEEQIPVYGLTKPLHTYSFLWQHFHYFIELGIAIKKQKTFSAKLKTLFGRPDTIDPSIRSEAEQLFHIKQNKETINQPLNTYVVWQMVVLLICLFVFILAEQYLSTVFCFSFTVFTLLTLINCGAIMEQKKWIFHVEFLRLLAVALIPLFQLSKNTSLPILILLLIFSLLMCYKSLQSRYLTLVYQ